MDKVVVLNIVGGSFQGGFNLNVSVRISQDGRYFQELTEFNTELPPELEIPELYRQWQSVYYRLEKTRNVVPLEQMRIVVPPDQITEVASVEDCQSISQLLQHKLDDWLNKLPLGDIRKLLRHIDSSDSVRFLVKSKNVQLQRLPWHLCSLFNEYPKAEVALAVETSQKNTIYLNRTVRILAIFGNDDGIDISLDESILRQLEEQKIATIQPLKQPSRQNLNEQLWNQRWDILFFAGHSSSQSQRGRIQINANDSFSLRELENALRLAVSNGLKLAIFNSCDGLGLLGCLASVGIPYTIVMREPIPDKVAHVFLTYFLEYFFVQGKTLHQSVRLAREKLQGMEDEFPCATWLPVICQNTNSATLTWFPKHHFINPRPLVSSIINLVKRRNLWLPVITVITLSITFLLIKEFITIPDPSTPQKETILPTPKSVNSIPSKKPVVLFGKSQGNTLSDISNIAVSHDQKILASKSGNGNIDIWNLEDILNSENSKEPFLSFRDSSNGSNGILAISPDVKSIASVGFGNSLIKIFSIYQKKEVVQISGASYGGNDMLFHPNKNQLFIGDSSNVIKVVNIDNKQLTKLISNLTTRIDFLAISNDGGKLVAGSKDGIIEIWNIDSKKLINSFKLKSGKLTSLSLNSDGKKIIAGFSNGSIELWNIDEKQPEKSYKITDTYITSAILSQDGLKVIGASQDGYIYFRQLSDNFTTIYKLSNYSNAKVSKLFDSSTGVFAIGFDGKYISIWNIPRS